MFNVAFLYAYIYPKWVQKSASYQNYAAKLRRPQTIFLSIHQMSHTNAIKIKLHNIYLLNIYFTQYIMSYNLDTFTQNLIVGLKPPHRLCNSCRSYRLVVPTWLQHRSTQRSRSGKDHHPSMFNALNVNTYCLTMFFEYNIHLFADDQTMDQVLRLPRCGQWNSRNTGEWILSCTKNSI